MAVNPSFDDLTAQFQAQAQAQLDKLTFLEGDVTAALRDGCAAMGDVLVRLAVQLFKNTFIDGAKGDALAALIDDHLNLQKQVATAAQVTLTVARTGGGAAGSLLSGFAVASQFDAAGNTITFTLDAPVSFGIGDNGPHTVSATATVAGRAGNIAAGLITRVQDTPFDPRITCTNALTAGGGNDEESDDELRLRARTFWQTLRRGTLAALEFGALTVPSVRIARASEDDFGIATVVVSDSDGNSTAQMLASVVATMESFRAAGSTVNVAGGTSLIVNVTGTLIAEDGVDTTVLGPVSAAAVAARMNKLRQGEILRLDTIKAAAINVDPDSLTGFVPTSPSADVVPTVTQVIRPGTITIT